jgi:hypothetical protein
MDIMATTIARAGSEAAGEFGDHCLNASFVGNHAIDAFRSQLPFKKCTEYLLSTFSNAIVAAAA